MARFVLRQPSGPQLVQAKRCTKIFLCTDICQDGEFNCQHQIYIICPLTLIYVCVVLRRSQRATPRVRQAPMAPPLTSPTRFRSTHRFIHSCFQRWRVAFLFVQNEATRHFRPPTGARYSARPFRPTGRLVTVTLFPTFFFFLNI